MFVFRILPSISPIFRVPLRYKHDKRVAFKNRIQQPQQHLQQLVDADICYAQEQKNDILRVFPNVKSTLNNMYNNLQSNLNSSYKCHQRISAIGKITNKLVYQSVLTINWPSTMTFNGYGLNKRGAETNAILKALEFLYRGNLIEKNGHPVTVSEDDKKKLFDEWNKPPTITMPPYLLDDGLNLIEDFKKAVGPYLESRNTTDTPITPIHREDSDDEQFLNSREYAKEEIEKEDDLNDENNFDIDLMTGKPFNFMANSTSKQLRSQEMYTLLKQRLESQSTSAGRKRLPMSDYKDALESALNNHQVVVIAGDTGCGKSTQVPQMILDKWTLEGRGADCNILISQPRRISAISLAKYVASERRERIGESVGYHVRLNYKRLENRGGVMFLTAGMLLQAFQSSRSMEGISHIVVDEVHERSVSTDLLLILLRRLIRTNPNLKLILMSASLSSVELQRYFGNNQCALIEVPGTLYPLQRHYLEDLWSALNLSQRKYQLQHITEYSSNPFINTDLVVDVIEAIDATRPPGAILCFLPGWQDISVVQSRLQEKHSSEDRLLVLPLHSRLSSSDQEHIFQAAPFGQRKVVLSTNIAETGLTVEDVVYVIDTGCHKEQRYDSRKDLSVLGNHWISKANSQQRAGRAGRVQPGEVFHIYSQKVHKDMSRFPVPEIMRIPLEHVVLQCKAYCGEESALGFLSDALSVPSKRMMSGAVRNLEELGLLLRDRDNATENLTPLGRRIVHFSTPPHLSKALIYSTIFKCVDSILSISAVLSSGRSIFQNVIENRTEIRRVKTNVHPTSDLLAMLRLFHQWDELKYYREKLEFCNDRNLSHRALLFNNGIKNVYSNHIKDSFMVREYEDLKTPFSQYNENNHNSQLLLGVLLAGVDRLLTIQKGVLSKGIVKKNSSVIKSLKGNVINTSSDCVLHNIPKEMNTNSQHLLCVHLTRDDTSRRTMARDLSFLEPLTVALFAGHSLDIHPSGEDENDQCVISVYGEEKISFHVDLRTGYLICELRKVIDNMINIMIETRGFDEELPENFKMLCDKIVNYISTLLENKEFKTKVSRKRSLYDEEDDL